MRKTLLLLFICYTLTSLAVIAQAEHLRPLPLAVFVTMGASLLIAGLTAMAIEAPYLPIYNNSYSLPRRPGHGNSPQPRQGWADVEKILENSALSDSFCLGESCAFGYAQDLPLGQILTHARLVGKGLLAAPSRAGTHVTVLMLVAIVTNLAHPDVQPIVQELQRADIVWANDGWVSTSPRTGLATLNLLRPLLMKEDEPVIRYAQPLTQIPSRARKTIITYTVQPGDTLFGVALQFDLAPETILWANPGLQSEPDFLQVGTTLDILPVDGVAHVAQDGDTVQSLAALYHSSVEAILTAEWNSLRPGQQPKAGQRLIIPGGKRELAVWQFPSKPNVMNPRLTQDYQGFCEEVIFLPMASGTFIWPTDNHRPGGNPYTWWHRAIDLASKTGDPVYASDGGTVIYAGWNTWGYGNLVVVEHGDGWQSWYAHLSRIDVQCGQHFYQGAQLGAVGSTGRSSGPHLHFEIRHDDELLNPLNMLE